MRARRAGLAGPPGRLPRRARLQRSGAGARAGQRRTRARAGGRRLAARRGERSVPSPGRAAVAPAADGRTRAPAERASLRRHYRPGRVRRSRDRRGRTAPARGAAARPVGRRPRPSRPGGPSRGATSRSPARRPACASPTPGQSPLAARVPRVPHPARAWSPRSRLLCRRGGRQQAGDPRRMSPRAALPGPGRCRQARCTPRC